MNKFEQSTNTLWASINFQIKEKLGELQIYFKKIPCNPASTKFFGGFGSFRLPWLL